MDPRFFPRFEYRGPPYPVRIVPPKRPFRIYPVARLATVVYYTERDQDKTIVGGPYPSVAAAVDHLRKFTLHV